MKIGLVTDAKQPNLALMKISAWHKGQGDEVFLNECMGMDKTYGSWLWNNKIACDINGGPAFNPTIRLHHEVENIKPDYSLYPGIDYSLGYTWSYCPRQCGFCVVPKQNNPKIHKSIWTFHDRRFKKINLLNNNTFADPQWYKTFEEIWQEDLIVHDDNGYDLRLLDDNKAKALKNTRFIGYIHFSWDQPGDENKIIRGLQLCKEYNLRPIMVYILTGFDTTLDEDIYRAQRIHDFGFLPNAMPYTIKGKKQDKLLKAFQRFLYLHYYRKYKSIKNAWLDYCP